MAEPLPRFHWIVPPPTELSAETIADARRRGLSARLVRVLSRRGSVDPATLAARFDDPVASLLDPRLLPDAAVALARVRAAVGRGERALVLGDFDADGLTGLAILVLALRSLGIDTVPYVPSRGEEGHGLSLAAVEHASADGRTLVLTADCGSTSHAEIVAARSAGIDVIVTDHHRLPDVLPVAVAIVNPHRADSRYPDRRLSGAGVAFKVAQLLLADEPGGAALALSLADLAAIGSVADVVPLEGENRAIARLGLARLASEPRPGLEALLRSAGVDPSRVTPETISFTLAPRLNALGRVGHAQEAAELLLTDDPDAIAALVTRIEQANTLRRELTITALAEARARVDAADGEGITIVLGDWPAGVIGLVAGRLADELRRPALVFSTSSSPWRGSARSAGGFDLGAAFAACGDLFERHGGHAAAAGCHLAPERFEELRTALRALAPAAPALDSRPSLTLDLVTHADSVDHVLLAELAPLEGTADEPPLLGIAGLIVGRVREVRGGHTQLTLRKGKDVLDGISFGRADLAEAVREGDAIDVAAHLGSRTFAGLETLQLEVIDVAPAGHLAALRRGSRVVAVPVEAEPSAVLVGSIGGVLAG